MADWIKSEHGYANIDNAEDIYVDRSGAVDYGVYAAFPNKQVLIKKFKTEKDATRWMKALMDARQMAKLD